MAYLMLINKKQNRMDTALPPDPQGIARHLSDLHLQCIRENEALGGALIADRLSTLRDIVWKAPQATPHIQKDHKEEFQQALGGLNEIQRDQLLSAYAQMGHLNEIANLAGREQFFVQQQARGGHIPGGVDAWINDPEHPLDAATAVEKLNQAVFEAVLTSHPTNVNSLASMQAQREIAVALNAIMHNEKGLDSAGLRKAVASYASKPLLNRGDDEEDKNFTVYDETQIVINSLGNIYDDLPRIYNEYDRVLNGKNGYKPGDLKLNMHFKSWGSAGDKDGNPNVTAEKTLEAIAMHTDAILKRYLKDIGSISTDGKMQEWQDRIKAAHDMLQQKLLPELAALRKDGDEERARVAKAKESRSPKAKELSDRFDGLSKELAGLRNTLNGAYFVADLQHLYNNATDPDFKADTLDLLRKARVFGFEFAKIEYRETAEEYKRVVDVLTDQKFAGDDPVAREKGLTKLLLQSPQQIAELYRKRADQIVEEGACVPYSKENTMPIVFNTMKRMELARDIPDMFEDNVLAECGAPPKKKTNGNGDSAVSTAEKQKHIAARGACNMLEAQFVQQAAMDDNGKRPILGIVPLFEEPETMMNIDAIIKGAYDNPAYQQHLRLLADHWHGGRKTQQVQIAQSDNARRAGIPAARAFIHEAHKKLHALNEKYHVAGQFYVGGSISDAYRNGVRALSASVNAFNMHKFAKFTFQGGDTLNYFNTPFSNTRLFTRQLVHAADKLKKTDLGWAIEQDEHKFNNVFDNVAIEALKHALPDYRTQDFTPEAMGIFLSAIRYQREVAAGNLGSRIANRPGHEGVDSLTPVELDAVRTIGFSEAMQHNDLLPSWIGAQTLRQHLRTAIGNELDIVLQNSQKVWDHSREIKELVMELKPRRGASINDQLSAKQIKAIYTKSATFRDAIDKCAYGIAMTDMDRLSRRLDVVISKVPEECPEIKKDLTWYKNHLLDSYKEVGGIAYAALMGKDLIPDDFRPRKGCDTITRYNSDYARIAAAVTDALDKKSGIGADIHRKIEYRAFPMYLKQAFDNLPAHTQKVMHCALDTVVHGRLPKADDPMYGKSVIECKTVVGSGKYTGSINPGSDNHLQP